MSIICEGCGEWEAQKGSVFCAECNSFLDEEFVAEDCSECNTGAAELFGVCTDCYDEAFKTGAASNADSTPPWKSWNYTPPPSPPPYTPPTFSEEATHHHRIAKRVAVSA